MNVVEVQEKEQQGELILTNMKKKYYIGFSLTFHDPGIAIVDDQGNILFAEATERYLQYKKAMNCEPDRFSAIAKLLKTYCEPECDFVVAYNWTKLAALLSWFAWVFGRLRTQTWLTPKFADPHYFFMEDYKLYHMMLSQRNMLQRRGMNFVYKVRTDFPGSEITWHHCNHHLTHAAMTCFTSPFSQGVCLIVDGYGQWGSTACYSYKNGKIKVLKEAVSNGSLGFFYAKITELCGFHWLKGEEWKVMGLACYGKLDDELYKLMKKLLRVKNGVLHNCSYREVKQTLSRLEQIAGEMRGDYGQLANLAYTGQYLFSEWMRELLDDVFTMSGGETNLLLGGGCALNSSFNGSIVETSKFERVYIPSAPADDGTALGAALLAYHQDHPQRQSTAKMASPYLGASMNEETLQRLVEFSQLPGLRHLPGEICEQTAIILAQGKLVGWVQGRAEFGPRALGNRSILADPRDPGMKDKINQRVKFREQFRPFAPAILDEFGEEYFENYQDSPFMERALRFREQVRDKVPAVVHSDQTGRLQSVTQERNAKFYQLLQCFYQQTQVPVLLNTSFNIMGKPIIHSVEDAISVFFTTGLDALVIGDYLIEKG